MDLPGHSSGRATYRTGLQPSPLTMGLHVLRAARECRDHRPQGPAGRPPAGPHQSLYVDRHPFRQLLHGELHAQVVRDGVEAAAVHDPCPGLHRSGVVGEVHPVDELRLTGQVHVVRTGRCASGDQRLAVLDIGTDGRDDDPCGGCHRGERPGVVHVGLQQVHVGAEPGTYGLQLGAVAPRERPAEAGWRVLGKVVGGQRTGEPARAEQDEVVLAVLHRRVPRSESARPPAPSGRDASARPRASMSATAARSVLGTVNRAPSSTSRGIRDRNTLTRPIQAGTCTTRDRFSIPRANLATASSSGYTRPASGIPPRTRLNTGCSSAPRTRSVSTKVRYATPTSTPRCLSSTRRLLPRASTPALATLYDARPGRCTTAARDETSSRYPLLSSRCGSVACTVRQ